MDYYLSDNFCMLCSQYPDNNNSDVSGRTDAGWDYIILTASNEKQALIYWEQIKNRLNKGLLPQNCKYAVFPDIKGKRIGSGGATLNVLGFLWGVTLDEKCFTNKKILVIHSGGDSKRVPQYSVCGKLFSPVPHEQSPGVSSTLFDEIIASVSEIPSKMLSGMLTLSGDALIQFNPLYINLSGCDAAAISVSEKVSIGINHGVFIPNEEGFLKIFLHKSTEDELYLSGAVDSCGNVNLDTGAIWFSENIVKELFKLISVDGKVDFEKFSEFVNEKSRLSFYADFVYPMALGSSMEIYYTEKPEGDYTDELIHCRTALWKALHKYKMKLISLSPSTFIHFGTTLELLTMMTSDLKEYSSIGWKSAVNTNADVSEGFSANSSFVDRNTRVGNGSYIENSCLNHSIIGNNCIVSNITLDNTKIPDNTVVHCLKQNDGDYVVRIYGIKDNPKQDIDNGATFLGIPMRKFLQNLKLCEDELWDKKPFTLWNAKLFLKCCSLEKSLNYALSLCTDLIEKCENNIHTSLEQSFENADFEDILLWQAELSKRILGLQIMPSE